MLGHRTPQSSFIEGQSPDFKNSILSNSPLQFDEDADDAQPALCSGDYRVGNLDYDDASEFHFD